jgi:hypothetical protein
MKSAIALTAAVITSAGLAGITPAAAYHLNPQGNFTGDGDTSATKNGVSLPCKAHFTGSITRTGVGYVKSGSFKDNGAVGCTSVKLTNLPWKSTAVSATRAKIFNVTFTSPIGNCGPGTLPTTLKNGVISFTAVPLPGGCTVSGKITTSPTISIVP